MLRGLPLPVADDDTEPFWAACREKRFVVPRCGECGRFRWPPGPMCPNCQSTAVDWVESSGLGRVYSWVVVNHAPHPELADQVPYVVALVELPQGVRVLANITDCESTEIVADMAVELHFEKLRDGSWLPNFRPANHHWS